LGVSARTIERDLIDLQAPPHSLPLDREGWLWKLNRTVTLPLPPVTFTREQAATLYLGARLVSQYSGSLTRLAVETVARLAQALPADIGLFLGQTSIPTAKEPHPVEAIFSVLVTGWLERRKVICRHQTLGKTAHTYHLAPYTFEPAAVGHAIYVIGQCDEDPPAQLRTLKLDRIQQATLTDETFAHPSTAPIQTLEHAWHIWGSNTPPVVVRLRFTKRVAERVRETQWHPTQEITLLSDGGCEWQAWIAEPQEMLPWIRGWGAECEVLAPLALRSKMIREARRLIRLYGVTSSDAAAPPPALAPTDDPFAAETEQLNRTFRDFFGG
jgi:CRISPR-associated endonuclease/helicase Cas3